MTKVEGESRHFLWLGMNEGLIGVDTGTSPRNIFTFV